MIGEDEAWTAVLAFEAYATGEYSDQQLADLLNREGYPPLGWKADRWIARTVRYMLRNPFYAGWVRYADELHQCQHEPIISQELWDRVQEVRKRRNKSGCGPRTGRVYLLHRVCFCCYCRLPLYMNRNEERSYYLDSARNRGKDCPDVGRGVPMDLIDQQVAELVSRLRLLDDWRDRLEELANHKQQR
jgi:hypothetical protein